MRRIMLIITILFGIVAVMVVLSSRKEGAVVSPPEQKEKISIEVACNSALAYMTFPDDESTQAFLQECREGKHPDVIQRFEDQLMIPGEEPSMTMCTADAQVCPTGPGVGRSGPRCSFDACPYSEVSTTGWKEIQGERFTLMIPADWTAQNSTENNGLMKKTTLSGAQGQLILASGVGFGGACDNTWSKVMTKSGVLEGCFGTNDKSQVIYSQLSKSLGMSGGQEQFFDGTVIINSPSAKNADTIYTILASLEIK